MKKDLGLSLDMAIKANEAKIDEAGYKIDQRTYDNYLSKASFDSFKATLSDAVLKMYGEGSGTELDERCDKDGNVLYPPKMASYGSSSRFICKLAKDKKGFEFEKKLSTTVGGTANLDGYLEDNEYLFVEAKCREPYGEKSNIFGRKYQNLYDYITDSVKSNIACKIENVSDKTKMKVNFYCDGKKIEHFDIKQMISHLLGIATAILKDKNYADKPITFLYLIYNPTQLKFDDADIGDEIRTIYKATCDECESINFTSLFEVILMFLQSYKYNEKKDTNLNKILNGFRFELCDQNSFCKKVGIEVDK